MVLVETSSSRDKFDVTRLRGYLLKEKQMKNIPTGSDLLFTRGSVRRWFVVDEERRSEYLLYYYKTQASMEPSGWYFLSELEEVDEDTFLQQIILRHPSRVFRLKAETIEEHRMWIQGLSLLCRSYGAKIFKDGQDRFPAKVPKSAVMDSQQPQKVILSEGRIPQAENNETAKKMELLFLRTLNNVDDKNLSSNEVGEEESRNTPSTAILQDYAKRDGVYKDDNAVSRGRIDELQTEEHGQTASKHENSDNSNGSLSFLVTPKGTKDIHDGERMISVHDEDAHLSTTNSTSDTVTNGFEMKKERPTLPSHTFRSVASCKNDNGTESKWQKNSLSNPFPYYSLKRSTASKNPLQPRRPSMRRIMMAAPPSNASNKLEEEIVKFSTTIVREGAGTSHVSHIDNVLAKSSEGATASQATDINWDDWDKDLTAILMDQRTRLQRRNSVLTLPQKRVGLTMVELCGVEPDPNFLHDDWDAYM